MPRYADAEPRYATADPAGYATADQQAGYADRDPGYADPGYAEHDPYRMTSPQQEHYADPHADFRHDDNYAAAGDYPNEQIYADTPQQGAYAGSQQHGGALTATMATTIRPAAAVAAAASSPRSF